MANRTAEQRNRRTAEPQQANTAQHIGGTKVACLALGRSPAAQRRQQIHKLAHHRLVRVVQEIPLQRAEVFEGTSLSQEKERRGGGASAFICPQGTYAEEKRIEMKERKVK